MQIIDNYRRAQVQKRTQQPPIPMSMMNSIQQPPIDRFSPVSTENSAPRFGSGNDSAASYKHLFNSQLVIFLTGLMTTGFVTWRWLRGRSSKNNRPDSSANTKQRLASPPNQYSSFTSSTKTAASDQTDIEAQPPSSAPAANVQAQKLRSTASLSSLPGLLALVGKNNSTNATPQESASAILSQNCSFADLQAASPCSIAAFNPTPSVTPSSSHSSFTGKTLSPIPEDLRTFSSSVPSQSPDTLDDAWSVISRQSRESRNDALTLDSQSNA